MIKKGKHVQVKQYRINQRITAPQVRVLDAMGEQIGILSRDEALKIAREQELDLVEVAPMAKPPVVKVIDFNKFLYQLEKKKREEKRKAKISETKEIRLGPFISENDLQVMVKRGRDFLEAGDKLRLVVKFKGRQIARPEFGRETMKKAIESLADISKVDRDPHFEGRQLVALLSVERNKKTNENEEKN